MYNMLEDIPLYHSFRHIEPVDKGWSSDKKYLVETNAGQRLLLRVSDISEMERKREEYASLERMRGMGVPISKPVDFGACNGNKYVYMLLEWIEGQDAIAALPALPIARQYALGREAGMILRAIHTIPAHPGLKPWAERFNAKIDRVADMYRACPDKPEGAERIFDYVQTHRHLLAGRPQTYQHGDYHIGNMILTAEGRINIIDVNRQDYGDPWEEFNRIVWCADTCEPFAAGRVGGYFDGGVPDAFFPLLKLYISNNILAGVAWALTFGQEEVDNQRRLTEKVLRWYNNMADDAPGWYR